MDTAAPYGTYHVTNSGTPRSWADYARRVFELTGHDPARVSTTTTEEYAAGKRLSPRPLHSTLALDKARRDGVRER
ncbi:sugar nucleotide-binding protein [Nocardioides convexus]|uniref:sugar nucleotide-binding protein n=1 Tax=Nocardioides convexus TaxID=2712224 RepID=UPI00241881DE|nr:sugar nucleotide-binding protein [Nocardioides convexus]